MTLTTKQVDSTHYAQDVIPLCFEKQYDIISLGYDLGENQKNGQQILQELRISEVISRHCIYQLHLKMQVSASRERVRSKALIEENSCSIVEIDNAGDDPLSARP